jgi:hypothetical protein
VAFAIVRHVPTRAMAWGAFALIIGIVILFTSPYVARLRYGPPADAMNRSPLVFVLFVIPLAGTALFTMHGLHRGVARVVLDLEKRFGLVSYVVDRVMRRVETKVGGPLSNLPLARFERMLKGVLDEYLGSDEMKEGGGLTGWVLRAAKRAIVRRIDTYLLAAYRAEEHPDGTGGGVLLARVRERAAAEISTRLGHLVMAPLNKQLALFLFLYVGLGFFWFHLFQLVSHVVARPHATFLP